MLWGTVTSCYKDRKYFSLSQFHGKVQGIPDFFFLEEEWLLIVSRARHVFGTGPGIIQQGTAAYMQRAELVGTFINVSWGHQLLAWFLEVMSSAFSRPVCNKLCKIGNGFGVPLLEAVKVMPLESWQFDIKALNYKYRLDADPVQNCFSPAGSSETASFLWSFHQRACSCQLWPDSVQNEMSKIHVCFALDQESRFLTSPYEK